jgi:serine protease Do
MFRELLPRLLKDGRIKRSAIGVVVAAVQGEDVERLKLPSEGGARVRAVVPGGPADRAGLAADDVIVGFAGDPVPTPERLRWLASLAGVGQSVTLRVIRSGRPFEVKLDLQELPDPGGDQPMRRQP